MNDDLEDDFLTLTAIGIDTAEASRQIDLVLHCDTGRRIECEISGKGLVELRQAIQRVEAEYPEIEAWKALGSDPKN